MDRNDLPQNVSGSLVRQIELTEQREKLLRGLETRINSFEKQLRGVIVSVIGVLLVQVFFYLISSSSRASIFIIIYMGLLGAVLWFTKSDLMNMKREVSELKTLIKRDEL